MTKPNDPTLFVRLRRNAANRASGSAIAPALLLAGAIVLGLVQMLAAAPGDLDTTFGPNHNGRVLTDFGPGGDDDASAVAIQPDGKIVVAGFSEAMSGALNFGVARYGPDGNLDPSFGTGGKVTTSFSNSADESDQAFAVAVQGDGAIVVAGTSNGTNFALARYTAQGALDPSFSGGKVTTTFGGEFDQASALAIQPDGKIVAAGFSTANGSSDFALARYNTNGSLDPSFGSGGKVLTDFSSQSEDAAFALAIQPDGKILVAGYSDANGSDRDFALVRYTSDGRVDTTFGTSGTGMVLTDFAQSDDEIRAIALQSDGKIVVAGMSDVAFALARYLPNGQLDTSFGAGGKVTTTFGNAGSAQAVGVAIQSDGKIAVGGAVDTNFVAARYNANGGEDTTFGNSGAGSTSTSFGGVFDTAAAMALQPDGKIVVAGFSSVSGNDDFALVRFTGGESTNTPLLAAVLPSSRSVQVNTPATAFATIINPGTS